MFRSAIIKLTSFYVLVVLLICLVFSIATFTVAAQRIERGAQRQQQIIRNFGFQNPQNPNADRPRFDPNGVVKQRIDEQVKRDRRDLLYSILLANIVILTLSTFAAYLFAKRTLKPIEQSHAAQSKFTADASHELRTPLAVMKTEIEVALRNLDSDEDLRNVLKSNLEEVNKLTNLSNQLLGLTRVSQETRTFEKLNISEIGERKILDFQQKNDLKINTFVEPNLFIVGNAELVQTVFDILLNNAIQYARQSPVEVDVSISSAGEKIILVIKDNGIGIPKSDLPHVFDRFFRGTQARTLRKNGHGLGLALAKEISEKLKGKISVDSVEGEYSLFKIVLPKVAE